MTVVSGHEVSMPCDVTGDPRPTVLWQKNVQRMSALDLEQQGYEIEDNALVISSVRAKDSGRYLCIAENPSGVVTQEIYLVVQGFICNSMYFDANYFNRRFLSVSF